MKIKEIYIKDFRQFKDFHLDLTYPKGHAKEGQPLEKVCFIGQSGTGKTSLLKLIFLMRMPGEFKEKLNASSSDLINRIGFKVSNDEKDEMIISFKESTTDIYALSDNMMSEFSSAENSFEQVLNHNFLGMEIGQNWFETFKRFGKVASEKNSKLIYFPSNLKFVYNPDVETKNGAQKKVFDFSKENIYELWISILEDVRKYQEQILASRQKISIAAESGNLSAIDQEVAKLKKWESENFNPVNDIADNCINPLVKHFSLQVKRDLDFRQKEDIGFIKIETLEKTEVPYDSWSTGTKQVVLTALPLYKLKPENSTILFDEPETSLYPDLQRIVISYYQNLSITSQFFYATHSPIIASSFEPWEIVELKFDDKGHVYREKYYEGENHIDNYFIDPRFLNFDMVLKKVFDMEDTNSDLRYEALAEYAMLKNQLNKLKAENKLESEEAKKIYEDFKALSKKLAVNPEQYAAT